MSATPNLSLPYIFAAQSQKHVTHNEAIRAIDALVQLAVLDRDLAAPPSGAADGARYIVAGGATGAWAGHVDKVAAWQDGVWTLIAPREGWIAWIADEDALVVWNGTAWLLIGGGGGVATLLNPADGALVGVNTTADTTNRLAVKSTASLFDNVGNGHQQKINKAASGDTASQLYQNNYIAHAEVGLTGDNDFHFKVSPDGSTWKDAIQISRTTGAVTMPFTTLSGGREKLTAARTYYVRLDGSNSNNGLANTSGGAFLTWQKAWDVIVSTLDLGGQAVTVQIADGTYTSGLSISSAWTGGGTVIFNGNASSSAAVHLNPAAGQALYIFGPCPGDLRFTNLKMSAAAHTLMDLRASCQVTLQNFRFGASTYGHIIAEAPGAYVNMYGTAIHIEGGSGSAFANVSKGAVMSMNAVTLTLAGTPGFPGAFASAIEGGVIVAKALTFASGSATGPRYFTSAGGIVNTNGGGASYLPGSSAGSGAGYF